MTESNETSLLSLTNEVILKIFSYLDDLSARSNLADVCLRFEKLAYDGNWRKNIFISMLKVKKSAYSHRARMLLLDTLMDEIHFSNTLETVTIEIPSYKIDHFHHGEHPIKRLLAIINKKIDRLDNLVGSCVIGSYNINSHIMKFFSPKNTNAVSVHKMIHPPANMKTVKFEGKDTTALERILEMSKELLTGVKLICPITLNVLKLLGDCDKLEYIFIGGELVLSSNVNENNLSQIKSKKIILNRLKCSHVIDPTSKLAVKFFSDQLHTLIIPFSLLLGSVSEISSSNCPKLFCLQIKMDNGADITDSVFANFCKKLLRALNDHSCVHELYIWNIDQQFKQLLSDSIYINCSTRDVSQTWNDNTVSVKYYDGKW